MVVAATRRRSSKRPEFDAKTPDLIRAEERRHRFLYGPAARTLIVFSIPTMVQVGVQALVNIMEGYFVGCLGTDALAGITLVFPMMTLRHRFQ